MNRLRLTKSLNGRSTGHSEEIPEGACVNVLDWDHSPGCALIEWDGRQLTVDSFVLEGLSEQEIE